MFGTTTKGGEVMKAAKATMVSILENDADADAAIGACKAIFAHAASFEERQPVKASDAVRLEGLERAAGSTLAELGTLRTEATFELEAALMGWDLARIEHVWEWLNKQGYNHRANSLDPTIRNESIALAEWYEGGANFLLELLVPMSATAE